MVVDDDKGYLIVIDDDRLILESNAIPVNECFVHSSVS